MLRGPGCLNKDITVIKQELSHPTPDVPYVLNIADGSGGDPFVKKVKKIYIYDPFISNYVNIEKPKQKSLKGKGKNKKIPGESKNKQGGWWEVDLKRGVILKGD